jgi:dynamin 1-like protein
VFHHIFQNHTVNQYNHEHVTNAGGWIPNFLPTAGSEREASSESSPNVTPTHLNDGKSVLSPQKPVNLLPEVPIQSSRKLSDREQRDCEVIGMYLWSKLQL